VQLSGGVDLFHIIVMPIPVHFHLFFGPMLMRLNCSSNCNLQLDTIYLIRRLTTDGTVCCVVVAAATAAAARDARFFPRSPLTCELRVGRFLVALPYLQLLVHCKLHFLSLNFTKIRLQKLISSSSSS